MATGLSLFVSWSPVCNLHVYVYCVKLMNMTCHHDLRNNPGSGLRAMATRRQGHRLGNKPVRTVLVAGPRSLTTAATLRNSGIAASPMTS